jgi:hypothetical protein
VKAGTVEKRNERKEESKKYYKGGKWKGNEKNKIN